MIDKIAPDCIKISKNFIKSFCDIFKIFEAKIKCAVDEMGKNSVKPSIIPKKIALKIFIFKDKYQYLNF
jgi:hypothetical protein